jgi:hypothetical protein
LRSRVETSASPTPSSWHGLGDVESGVGTKVSAAAHRLLVARGEGAQGVLDAVAELAQDLVGHVVRVLRAEVDAHALGADQPHHLLDPLQQRRRAVVEQQVRLVEEEHQLGLARSPTSGRFSNSSDSSHSRKLEYRRGLRISLSARAR